MRCEILFCQAPATARITIPQYKPQFRICEKCQAEWIERAKQRGATVGQIRISKLEQAEQRQ